MGDVEEEIRSSPGERNEELGVINIKMMLDRGIRDKNDEQSGIKNEEKRT